MARRNTGDTSNNPLKQQIELKLPHEEAFKRIDFRINEGKSLSEFSIRSEQEFEEFKAKYRKWDDYNKTFLGTIFTTDEKSIEYERVTGVNRIATSWHDVLENYTRTLTNKVTKLESIAESLELFPVASLVKPDARENDKPVKPNSIFIGHGRSKLWARVKTFLQDDYGIDSFSFESDSHVGESIVPILQGFLNRATFAILILTAEDETSEGTIRARQNVVHEAGLFQGKLGFSKVVLLKQEGLEQFSNVDGLQYIGFHGDNIEQTFYDIQRVLKREGIIR